MSQPRPGEGGLIPPPVNAPAGQATPVGVQPGTPTQIARVTQVVITPGAVLQGIFTYSSNPPAAGTLVESAGVATGGTDKYGNHFVTGHASYGANFAASLNAGVIQFYTGSLAAGWTAVGELEIDSSGDLFLLAATGRSVSTNNNTLDDGAGNMIVAGTLSVGGSTSTGPGDNGGVTGGPSGTVNAFPAAGPNHTHPEIHHHPL